MGDRRRGLTVVGPRDEGSDMYLVIAVYVIGDVCSRTHLSRFRVC